MDTTSVSAGTYCPTCDGDDPRCLDSLHGLTVPPCEALELEPPCEVCDDTGEVTEAAGRGGRAILPCTNCDAYDRLQEQLADEYNQSRED